MASETTFDHQKVVFSWVKVRKMPFSQNPLWPNFDLLESNSIYIFVHENQKITMDNFFSLDACLSPMWGRVWFQIHALWWSWASFHQGITHTPPNDSEVEKYNYVQANQSTAYFSNLKSAQMCPLLWLADPKPQPISSKTYKWALNTFARSLSDHLRKKGFPDLIKAWNWNMKIPNSTSTCAIIDFGRFWTRCLLLFQY